jgi:hypothetical protein
MEGKEMKIYISVPMERKMRENSLPLLDAVSYNPL